MRRWDGMVDRYVEEYSARGLCEDTVKGVRRELDRWGTWMKGRRPRPRVEQINAELLTRYVSQRSAFRSKSTVRTVMGVMRGMGEFLVREGYWAKNPLRWMKGPKIDPRSRLPHRISRDAMRRLWEAVVTNRQEYPKRLWLAILSVLYGAGIRRGELVGLDMDDWIRDEGILMIDGHKTGRERNIAIPELTGKCLEFYLVQRHNHLEKCGRLGESALFVNRDGRRFEGGQITQGIRRIAKRGGLAGITTHQFRHTCASDLLESGLHVAQVQQILGHQTIGTTVRYLHISDPARAKAANMHPINDILRRTGGNHD